MYKEQVFEYEIWCRHQGILANQGITWCNEGHFPCNEDCPYRNPDKVKTIVTSASTDDPS